MWEQQQQTNKRHCGYLHCYNTLFPLSFAAAACCALFAICCCLYNHHLYVWWCKRGRKLKERKERGNSNKRGKESVVGKGEEEFGGKSVGCAPHRTFLLCALFFLFSIFFNFSLLIFFNFSIFLYLFFQFLFFLFFSLLVSYDIISATVRSRESPVKRIENYTSTHSPFTKTGPTMVIHLMLPL